MRIISFITLFALYFAGSAFADDLVPDRQVVLHRNVDFYGSDVQTIFDTSLKSCENACRASSQCSAFTFNSRANSCFLKREVSEQVAYEGAFSGTVSDTPQAVLETARIRAEDLEFLQPFDLEKAQMQAWDLARAHVAGGTTPEALIAGAKEEQGRANVLAAMRLMGAATVITDGASEWLEYARLSLMLRTSNGPDLRAYRLQAQSGAINAYLRAETPDIQARALVQLAKALDLLGRGRDSIPALRQAQILSPQRETDRALDVAIAKYGLRVTDHQVDSDSARPRVCAQFSEDLAGAGVDYSVFVQTDVSGLAVLAEGRQLCLEGVTHGTRYRVTLRAGLPAASGEALIKPVTLNLYVRDRSPAVHFPGRAYVLPKSDDAGLPIVSVNVSEVDLVLRRLSDRNLIRAFQERYFDQPLYPWEEERFSRDVAQEVWRGTGEVVNEINQDITTRLPLGAAIADQPAGVYVLQASVPGADPYDMAPATQWFVVSDLGLASMLGADGLHVFVRSLSSGEPVSGGQVELVSRANAVLGTVQTDARGYAHFPAGLTAGHGAGAPALVVVNGAGDDIAFLSLTEPEFDLSDRGVEGRPPAPPIDLFLTTDRGAYRAGEVIHATALVRDGKAEAIDALPVTAILSRPDGVEYSRALSNGSGAGGHVFALPLGGAVQRGTWRLDLHADPEAPALASRTLLVEDFLPERIDYDLTLPPGDIRVSDMPDLSVDVRYLFGAPGGDLVVKGYVVVRAAQEIEGWPGYRFGHYTNPVDTESSNLPSGIRTDAQGHAVLPVSFPAIKAPGVPLEAQINLLVSEGSGRPVERNLTRAIVPNGPMIGVKPLFEDELPEGGEARFNVIALSPDLTLTPMDVRWTINRVQTRYQWYRLHGSWNWEPVTTRTRVASGDATLGDRPFTVAAPVDWGRYEIVVSRTEGQTLVSAQDFYAGWYGAADASTTPDMLDVSLDADSYKPGDTATLRMVPRTGGKALVTVVSNRLIDMVAMDVVPGENLVSLPVTDDWGAGAYVTATVIQPMDTALGRNPTRALGLTHASVDPGAHHLGVTLDVAAEVKPRGPLEVALKVAGIQPGETAFATIAAVDVGILNLTSFGSPDPSAHYFGQRRLGVGMRDLYGRLIDGLNGAMGAIRSGGDAMAEMRMQAPPPTEALLAQFSGVLSVGADGMVRTTFDLPEYNGSVRLMAVVWSPTGVGQAAKDVLVRDPVVMTASLPRFMSPGDDARLLLELVHATGPAGDMQVSIQSDGVRVEDLSTIHHLTLAQNGTARLAVPIHANAVGLHQIALALTTPDGTRLTKTLMLPVQSNDPVVARTSRFDLAAGDSFTMDSNVFDGFMPGSAKATLASGPLARINALGLLERLDRYPYGCTEQLTSRALPLLYFGTVAEAMGLTDREDIPSRIVGAIDNILSNQAASGSFGLWRPGRGDLWLDAYVSDFLSRARAQGYSVPDTAFRAALDSLRNNVNYAPDFDSGGEALAYALYVLAREGAAAMGDLRYYVDEKSTAFSTPLASAHLGAALAAYGDQARADKMFIRASRQLVRTNSGSTQTWRDDYGTNLRDAAAVLTLAMEAGSTAISPDALVTRVAKGAPHLSTQEAAWSLLATNALISDNANSGLTVNGARLNGPLVEVMDSQTAAGALDIHNGGADETVLTLTTYGVPLVPEPAGGQGYSIERRYFTLEGDPVDISTVKQGSRLVTVLTVKPFGRSDGRLMVSDPLPAGFEIDNPHLLQTGDVKVLDWLKLDTLAQMSEFRQDRFLAAVNWRSNKAFRLGYIVRAITPGDFHHPAASVEDMYRPSYRARGETGRVRITE